MHQAHDRRHSLQLPRHRGGPGGGAPSEAALHGRLYDARDADRLLAIHAARRRQGLVRLVQLNDILGGAACAVDGAAQDGVRVAPKARRHTFSKVLSIETV